MTWGDYAILVTAGLFAAPSIGLILEGIFMNGDEYKERKNEDES